MRAIRDIVQQSSRWTQVSSLRRDYELRANEDVLATLRWAKLFGSLATAESSDGSWTFKRVGLFRPRLTVRAVGSEVQLAEFKLGWKGDGTLTFATGQRYEWRSTDFLQAEWAFRNESQQTLVRFKPIFSQLTQVAELKIEPLAISMPELSLLILLGWYCLLLMNDDAEEATVETVTES